MKSEMTPGDKLQVGDTLVSPDSQSYLKVQNDCNVVQYYNTRGFTEVVDKEDEVANTVWATKTNRAVYTWKCYLEFQTDSNLVLYAVDDTGYSSVLWASGTHGCTDVKSGRKPIPGRVELLDNGELTINEFNGDMMWTNAATAKNARGIMRPFSSKFPGSGEKKGICAL